MADTSDSKSDAERREGSTPFLATQELNMPVWRNGRRAGLRNQYLRMCRFDSCHGYTNDYAPLAQRQRQSP
jgi:hypothetical protein